MDLTAWKISDPLCLGLGLLLGLMAGYIDLHVHEVQPSVLLLILFAMFLGFANPTGAWRWALIIGAGIPLAHLIGRAVGYYPPYPVLPNVFATCLAFVPAVIGAYCGVMVRRFVTG
ncbi:MAG TPA: hypothetical protein VFD58_17370 [Blastocatellia bacterium]|nr:hypothetical protein [Blastocatellia bacterium]